MAGSVTITLTDRCDLTGGGGEHLKFTITGAKDLVIPMGRDDLLVPMTDEEMVACLKGLVKLGKIGRTNLQWRTVFTTGVVVTI